MNKRIQSWLILFVAGYWLLPAQASLIGYEGFLTTDSADDYTAGALNGQNAVVGNYGFNTIYTWLGNTSKVAVESYSLTHAALPGTAQNGRASVLGYTSARGSNRALISDPAASSSYYMSGLVSLYSSGRLGAGEYRAAGFMKDALSDSSNASIAGGLHYGIRNDGQSIYLAAFAGGNIYNIAELPAFDSTCQVVLKLDVSDTGTETLSAWYVLPGTTTLTEGFTGVSVETWSSVSDLRRLTLQTGPATLVPGTSFDEIYLGTELTDVTAAEYPPITGTVFTESFQTTDSEDDYTDGLGLGAPENNTVVSGNFGFSSSVSWQNLTGVAMPDSSVSLSHSGVVGSAGPGALQVAPQAGIDRNSNRHLASVPELAESYYFSALLSLKALDNIRDGDYVAVGVMNSITAGTAAVDTGMHLGFQRESGSVYLTAFAGGNAYNLLTLDASTVTNTYQVVLRLDVLSGGTDSLTAWYANDGDSELTLAQEAVSVETWSTTNDLQRLTVQSKSPNGFITTGAYFDELRFGNTVDAVTASAMPAVLSIQNVQVGFSGSDVVISWDNNGLGTFAVQCRDDLLSGTWSNVVEGIAGYEGTIYTTNTALYPQAFYRVVGE